MFRKLSGSLIVSTAVLLLAGCGNQQAQSPPVASHPQVARPANPNDTNAWHDYMGKVADPMAKAGAPRPFKFLVPSADDPAASSQRKQLETLLGGMAANNAFPGTVIAVGGPDPAKTADVLVAAFAKARPGSLKPITAVYIGDEANQARVQKTVVASGAGFRFVGM